ncbi:hypothetical protein [Serratia sp. JSRIV006]|uniref:hypothetical protein n=1 Tax=Serratia sp. JSRIV006 TaxID=2831896 RepID=UPI001CC0A5E4|nr:hypothetical protein [Serratia sp. JSRIV006]UAN64276.1 hypothetical protein KGP16_06790 [Serratia sp. JSRIV006]
MDKQTESRENFAQQNGMTMEFVDWFFDNKKDGCGNAWFIMAAAMWEGWKGRAESLVVELPHEVTHVTNKYYEEGRDDVISAIEAIGIRIKGERV